MDNLQNWNEVTKGLYRYVIASSVCYEIHVETHIHGTDILEAYARLYIVGEWHTNFGVKFERELLLEDATVQGCIDHAIKDNQENNK